MSGGEVTMDEACDDEQIAIWADDIIESIAASGFLKEPESYQDKVSLAHVIRREVRNIVRMVAE